MDRFVGMAVFAKVVETSSFAAAARHFDISPAMVSKHIRTLEERLGVRLLNRTTRSVSVTEAGARLLARVRPALDVRTPHVLDGDREKPGAERIAILGLGPGDYRGACLVRHLWIFRPVRN